MANIYKVGDVVRVIPDLRQRGHYGGQSVTREMVELAGELVTIREVLPEHDMSSNYLIKNSSWGWTNEMFMPITIEPNKAFSLLVEDKITEQQYNALTVSQGGI